MHDDNASKANTAANSLLAARSLPFLGSALIVASHDVERKARRGRDSSRALRA
jgi:hypothetical protein